MSAIYTDPDYHFMNCAPCAHFTQQDHRVSQEVPEEISAKGADGEFRAGFSPRANAGVRNLQC